jgi:hypothetical protein
MAKSKLIAVTVSSLLAALVIACVGVLWGSVETIQNREEAERLLEVTKGLRVGTAIKDEVGHITASFQNHRSDGTMNGAKAWTFRYDNYLMSRLHLAPYASMDALLVFKNGVLQKKSITVFVASGIAATVEERNAGFGFPAGDVSDLVPRHRTGITWNSATVVRSITISDNNFFEEAKRRNDWRISLSCLDRLGGCVDARSIISIPENEIVAHGDHLAVRGRGAGPYAGM